MNTENTKLVNADEVAGMLGVSKRHVYRLADAGDMPPPVRLRSLVRWPIATIEEWIAAGCPSNRTGSRQTGGRPT